MKKIAGAVCLLALTGCGPNPQLGVMDVARLPPEQQRTMDQVAVVSDLSGKSLGNVEATSCKNMMWDPAPTEENALEQLKVKAAALGGNAVANVTYRHDGTSFMTNCWSSITATGVVLRR